MSGRQLPTPFQSSTGKTCLYLWPYKPHNEICDPLSKYQPFCCTSAALDVTWSSVDSCYTLYCYPLFIHIACSLQPSVFGDVIEPFDHDLSSSDWYYNTENTCTKSTQTTVSSSTSEFMFWHLLANPDTGIVCLLHPLGLDWAAKTDTFEIWPNNWFHWVGHRWIYNCTHK